MPMQRDREFCIDNLLARIHSSIEMIRLTGLAPWKLEFPFPDSQPGLLFFFITLKPRVERLKKNMSLKYEPSSEPLHIPAK